MLYLKAETKEGNVEYFNTQHIMNIAERKNGYIKIFMGAGLYWDIKPNTVEFVEMENIFKINK